MKYLMVLLLLMAGTAWSAPSEEESLLQGAHGFLKALYGMVKLPFEMIQVQGGWRVVPQPYVRMIQQRNMI